MTTSEATNDLSRLESRLTALLALGVDARQRELGVRTKDRPVDVLLSDAGLSSKEIARLLGKTDRAVNLVLQAHRAGKASPGRVEGE